MRDKKRTRVLALQNCPTEGLGLYEVYLEELDVTHQILHPYSGESFPPLELYEVIIVGGTPVSVNDIRSQ